jgi:hypothetical protein
MKTRWIGFGEIEIDGRRYTNDLVIDAGRIEKRHKKASKAYRDLYGHTPLSVEEEIPWGGKRLIVGTGTSGQLPITEDVYAEAQRRGIEIVALPTREACALLAEMKAKDVFAILHVTC